MTQQPPGPPDHGLQQPRPPGPPPPYGPPPQGPPPPQYFGPPGPPKRPSWFGRHKVWTGVGIGALVLVAFAAGAGVGDDTGSDGEPGAVAVADPTTEATPDEDFMPTDDESTKPDITDPNLETMREARERIRDQEQQSDPAAAPEPEPEPEPEPALTVSQQNAIASAQDYLSFQAFSKRGLIDQLSSRYGEGFPEADAVFAVNHIEVDWYEQAVKSAKDYLSFQSFSRSGLIRQLDSNYGEGFTHDQAVYAVNQVGF